MAQVNLGRVVGYSAYEIAVQNGFEGTEAEWLASLKGDTGATGPQGPAGTTEWAGIEDKPFSSIGDGLMVDHGVLSATGTGYTDEDTLACINENFGLGREVNETRVQTEVQLFADIASYPYEFNVGASVSEGNPNSIQVFLLSSEGNMLGATDLSWSADDSAWVRTFNSGNIIKISPVQPEPTVNVSVDEMPSPTDLRTDIGLTAEPAGFRLVMFVGKVTKSPLNADYIPREVWDKIDAKQDTLTAGANIEINSNEISVPSIDFKEASSITGVDSVVSINGSEIYAGLESQGNEVGYLRINPEEGGIFGGSSIYQKGIDMTPDGFTFRDGANNKELILAPNANYDGLTVNGADIGGGSTGTDIRRIRVSYMSANSFSEEDKAYIWNYYNVAPEQYPFIVYNAENVYLPFGFEGGNDIYLWSPRGNKTYALQMNNNTVTRCSERTGWSKLIQASDIYIGNDASITGRMISLDYECEQIKALCARKTELLPACPTTTDGTFVLKATVANGAVTYEWVAEQHYINNLTILLTRRVQYEPFRFK